MLGAPGKGGRSKIPRGTFCRGQACSFCVREDESQGSLGTASCWSSAWCTRQPCQLWSTSLTGAVTCHGVGTTAPASTTQGTSHQRKGQGTFRPAVSPLEMSTRLLNRNPGGRGVGRPNICAMLPPGDPDKPTSPPLCPSRDGRWAEGPGDEEWRTGWLMVGTTAGMETQGFLNVASRAACASHRQA